MPSGNQIRFGIGFDVNRAGLNELKKSLLEIQQLSKKDVLFNFGGNEQQAIGALKQAKAAAKELEAILNKAFNPALGTINVSKFQNELNKLSSGELNSIYTRLSGIGAQGTNAFNRLATSAMTTNVQLKQTFSILESMKTTLANTVKWTVASSAVNALTGSISSAFNYVKALDSSLTDIRIVTGQSREEMAQFAVQANEAAQALGRQTKEYTNAALTYYQQGLGEAEVQARTEATLKAQNVTGAGTEMADYLTAVWNGFKVSAENTELYVDKLAAVADSSASNLSELAIAMSKVASTANNMGVDIDQLSAQISTIVATTRQAPETVGNALKTIYARINDIKSGSDEAEISLGNYTGKMKELGINVLDASGRLRDAGEVMEEIGSKWTSMTREQQIYLAQTMAGQRQMNNLVALFDNWQQYSDMLNVSLNAQGSLNEKNARYMDSLSAHLNQFKAATEGLQGNLIDPDGLNPVIDMGTDLVNIFSQLVATMGGMRGVLLATGSILTTSFSSNIADGLIKFNQNIQAARDNAAALQAQLELSDMDLKTDALTVIQGWNREATQYQQAGVMSPEQRSALNEIIGQYESLSEKVALFEEKQEEAVGYLQSHAETLRAVYKDAEEYDKIIEKIIEDKKIEDDVSESLLTALDSERDNFNSIAEELKEVEKQYKETAKAEEDYQKAAGRKTKDRGNKKTESTQAKRQLSESMQAQLERAQNELITQFTPGSDIAQKYEAAFADMQSKLAENVDPTTFAKRFFETYKQLLEDLKNKNEEVQNAIRNTTDSTRKQNEDALKQYEELVNQILHGAEVKQTIQGIVSGLGAVAGVASGVQTVTNAFKSLGDETLTTGQRIIRLIEGLGYGLPMAISSLKTFTSSLSDIKKGFSALRSVIIEAAAAKLKNAAADGVATGSELTLGQAIKLTSKDLLANAKAWIANQLAMLGWIAIAVVVVAAIVDIVKAIDQQVHAEEYAAQAASEHAEQMQQGYENAKQSYEDLKAAIEDYKGAKDAMDTLVAGTQEWNEALQKTYDIVLELLQKYPELGQYLTYDSNGVPTFSQEGLDKAVQLQQQEVSAAQQRAMWANNLNLRAQNEVTYKADAKEIGVNTDAVKELYEFLASDNKLLNQFLAAQEQGTGEEFLKQYSDVLSDSANKAAQAIFDNNINIKDSITAVKANTSSIEAQTQMFADSMVTDKAGFGQYKYRDAVGRAINNRFEQVYEQELKDLKNRQSLTENEVQLYAKSQGITDTGVANSKSTLKNLGVLSFSSVGWLRSLITGQAPLFGDTSKSYTFGDTEVTKRQMEQDIATEKAIADAQKQADIFYNNIRIMTTKVSETLGEGAAQVAANLVAFDYNGALTENQVKDIASSASINEVQNLANNKDLQNELQNAGVNLDALSDVTDEYAQTLANSLSESSDIVKDVLDISDEKLQEIADSGYDLEALNAEDAFKNISLDTVNILNSLFNQVEEQVGAEGTDLLKQVFSDMPKDQIDDFLRVLSEIDRSTSVEELSQKLSDAGFEVNNFQNSLLLLLNLFTGGGNIGDAVLASAEAIKKAKDIVSDIHYGDEISQEDFDELQRLGIENLSDFFTMTLDGTYQLVGNGRELRDIINQMQLDNFNQRMQDIKNGIDFLNNLKSSGGLQEDGTFGWNSETDFSQGSTGYNQMKQAIDAIIAIGGVAGLTVDQANTYKSRLENEDFGVTERDAINVAASQFGSVDDQLTYLMEILNAMQNTSLLTPLDTDVNVEDFERMAEYLEKYGGEVYGLSEDLKDNHEAAQAIAEDFLRADAAAESVESNIEKWSRALDNPQENIEDYLESLEELDNAYKDLLNLPNEDILSETFLQDAHNLQLMQDAINGNIDAYNELVDAAQQDILNQGILDNADGGMVIPTTINTEGLENDLLERINAIENSIEDIPIGAELEGEGFYMALDDLINAAGLAADDATALLASMGIDADVVEGPPTYSNNPASFSYYEPPTYEIDSVGMTGSALGGQFPFLVPRITQEGGIKTKTETQTDTSPSTFAIHVENARRGVGSGGNINRKKLGGSSGGRKSGGGGGRGGGGGSSKPKEPTKPFKSKIDPYHDINIKIGNTKEGLNKLEKQRDKLIGKAAVDNLKQQVDMMEKEKELLREKAEIAKEELQRQAQELANLGATFDTNGDILNYKDLLLNKQNQINEAITYGNTLQGDEREAYDKYIKDLEQEYKDLESAIKEYDDTQQILDDLELDYADLINEQIEKAVEAFNLEIELHLDLKDAQKEFNEFRKKVIDQIKDDEFGRLAEATARNYQNYYSINEDGTAGGIIPELRQHAEQIKKEIETMVNGGWSNIYGDNLKLAAEDLKTYNDLLMQNLEEAQDVIDEVHEHLLDAIDALSDAFDKQQEAFDKVDDFIQHDIELIQLVRGEEDYAALTGLWEQQVATDVQRLDKLRQQQDYWKQQIDQYEEGTDEWEAAMENWQESFAALNEAMIDSVKNLQAQWENSMNRILKDLGNSVYGGDRSRALEEWENLNWHSDRYLDNLARANGLLNLQAEFTKAINTTQDPKRQKELADLEQKQLDALSKKEHIREIDLKLAQQQLTVMQAQIALEDAQQSKTKMRLRRDSQGNYTYQYVADEDNIAEKTQEYMNALEEYRNMAKEGLRDVLDEMNDVYSEWEDKVREAFERFGSDTEAFKERIEVLQEEYFGEHGKMSLLAQEANDRISDTYVSGIAEATEMYNVLGETAMQKLLGPGGDSIVSMVQQLIGSNGGEIPSLLSHFMVDTYEPFIESLDQKTHDQLFSVDGIFPEWGAALSGLAKDYKTGFVPDVVEAMNLLLQSHQEYINGLGIIERAAGRTFKAVQDGLDGDTGYTKSLKTVTDELVDAQKAQVEQAKEVYKTLKDNEQAFKDQTKAAIDAANALYLYWLTLNGQTTGSLPYSFEGYTGVTSNPYSSKASPSSYSSGASGSGSSGRGSGGGSNNNSNGNSGYTPTGRSGKYDWRGIPWEYSPDNPNRKKGASYSSGGYTGAWDDSSGRLAILHQKELVLNEEDTKNMLAAVNITRAITNGVSSMATAALSHLSGGRKYSITDPTNESVLQNVVINADFPAVQDAAQIKQAFNELVNIASQRASKNRRAY